jgi:alpha-ketoglutarate-dependent 2,4-dichlorophenoxyacetate dioxygenase
VSSALGYAWIRSALIVAVVWDNTCVLHRSVQGTYEGKYLRVLRRTTVHDMSSQAWGLNEVGATWRSGLP